MEPIFAWFRNADVDGTCKQGSEVDFKVDENNFDIKCFKLKLT